mmetsp:Transcript_128671/g.222291  ORF Transcript_128671/g.222291 Transcript_128671/m.222291 type:complete len:733 (-) Transcript_128671:466-2664(-)
MPERGAELDADATSLIQFTHSSFYVVCSIVSALVGAQVSLTLVEVVQKSEVGRGYKLLMLLTSICQVVLCQFALHFIGLAALELSVPWGVNLFWTMASFVVLLLFCMPGLWLAMKSRRWMQSYINTRFPEVLKGQKLSMCYQLGMLVNFVWSIPTIRVIPPMLMIFIGLMGCQYLGVQSIAGIGGMDIQCHLSSGVLALQISVGLVEAALLVYFFILAPTGAFRGACVLVLVAVLALWHYVSIALGLACISGTDPVGGPVLSREIVFGFLVLAGSLGSLAGATFGKLSIRQHIVSIRQGHLLEAMVCNIANLDLTGVLAMEAEMKNPSKIEVSLFEIAKRLTEFRPFLPDGLWSVPEAVDNDETESESDLPTPRSDAEDAVENTSFVGPGVVRDPELGKQAPTVGLKDTPMIPDDPCRKRSVRSSINRSFNKYIIQLQQVTSPPKPGPPKLQLNGRFKKAVSAVIKKNNLSSLQVSNLTILWVKKKEMDFFGPTMNNAHITYEITHFMTKVNQLIHKHGGSVNFCQNGQILATWKSRTPAEACTCAMDIQALAEINTTQIIQTGRFLTGSTGDQAMRVFNVLGPLMERLPILAELANKDRNDVLITDKERDSAQYGFQPLPFERVCIRGVTQSVYLLYPVEPTEELAGDGEWMYELQNGEGGTNAKGVLKRFWSAYIAGSEAQAEEQLKKLELLREEFPSWYVSHLKALVTEHQKHGSPKPLKVLEQKWKLM